MSTDSPSSSGSAANRREFLTGRAAAKAAEHLAERAVDALDPALRPATYLVEISRAAMAGEFQVLLSVDRGQKATEAAVRALDEVERLEGQLSFFRISSELSFINRSAAAAPVAVESHLFRLLQYCMRLSQETAGAFDVTAAPLWELWGFQRRSGRFPEAAAVEAALQQVGSQHLLLDEANQSVKFLQEGLKLNLGAVGKGYALDRAAEHLTEAGLSDYLMHGGLSSMLARGNRHAAAGEGWKVAVRHPLRPQQRIAEIHLVNQGLGTSGSANQFFHHQGRRYSHILDPRTGWPADQVLGTTVLAPTATEADALSTAFFVLGVEGTKEYCHARPELSALLVTTGDREGETILHAIGMQKVAWRTL